jgi:uncharacterized protein
MSKYDVCIIGAGPGGIFTALELIERKPDLKICILEKGKPLSERDHKNREDLTCGFAGAGAYSDGKIIYSLDKSYGGNLQDYIFDLNYFQKLMDKVDETYMRFSNDKNIPIFGDDLEKINPIKIKAARNGMSLLLGRIRHCGTDQNEVIMKNLYNYLKDKVEIKFGAEVRDFEKTNDGFDVCFRNGIQYPEEQIVQCKYLALMPGRSGNRFFENIAKSHGLTTINNQIDIGVRVEFPNWVGKELDQVLYEPKLLIRTPKTELKTRTFCYNPNGFVVQESIKDEKGKEIVTVNGHSNSENGEQSQNTNFALLVSATFTEPFHEPSLYGQSVAKLCNMLADGGALVQRLKDLKNNVRSTPKRIKEMNLQPTLKEAQAGDLRFALPSKQIDAILESIEILDTMMPGLNGNDTLLYAPEIKFYSVRGKLTNQLETEIPNLYAGGDGAGVSRGIAQSSASGIVVANAIIEKIGGNHER